MTKKFIIASAIAAAVGGTILLRRIKTIKLEKQFKGILISEGLPNNIAGDIAKIFIRYRFDTKYRDKLVAEYVEEHIDDIPDEFVENLT